MSMTSKFLWHISHSVMVPVLVAAEIAPSVNRTHDPEFVAILVRTNSDIRKTNEEAAIAFSGSGKGRERDRKT